MTFLVVSCGCWRSCLSDGPLRVVGFPGKFYVNVVLLNTLGRGGGELFNCPYQSCTTFLSHLLVTFQGKYEEAQRVQMQALHVSEKALGPEHPNVAIACNVLAMCMQDQVTGGIVAGALFVAGLLLDTRVVDCVKSRNA